jgi:hypothetical protein
VMVTLTARTPCAFCGYLFRVFRFSSVRVNRRSLRETGTSLVAIGPGGARGFPPRHECPECGEPVITSGSVPVSEYRLDPEDLAAVGAYRAKRWGP